MTTKSKPTAEKQIRDIRRKTRRKRSSEEKIRVVLEGLRGEYSMVFRSDALICSMIHPLPLK